MRPQSYPLNLTLSLPPPSDEAAVEIQDFPYEILDQFAAHDGHQVDRFAEDSTTASLLPTPTGSLPAVIPVLIPTCSTYQSRRHQPPAALHLASCAASYPHRS